MLRILIEHNERVDSAEADTLTGPIINQPSEAKWSGQRVLISPEENKS